jgi:small redox-active disulfide protein 2
MKRLQVFGPGCAKCKKLAEVTEEAAKAMGIEYSLEKVSDLVQMMNHGIMSTPALAVDGEVKVAGRVPGTDEIKKMLA